MKTSNKLLLGAFGVLCILTLALVITARTTFDEIIVQYGNSAAATTLIGPEAPGLRPLS